MGADGTTTTNTIDDPHLGQVSSSTVDPGGLGLSATTEYEGTGSGEYRRQSATTDAAGNETTTAYYGADGVPASRDDPCEAGDEPIHQGGQVATVTDPDPDGSGPAEPRVEEYVYDRAGRRVAERIGDDPWTCTTYDERGRPQTITYPAVDEHDERVVTHLYAVIDNPFITGTVDTASPGGGLFTMVDLLGRTVASQDTWANVTTVTYDEAGRPASSQGPGGTITNVYAGDPAGLGRLMGVQLDGQTLATIAYDDTSYGRIDSIDYPAGSGNGGNGTSLAPLVYDDFGRIVGLSWREADDSLLTSNERTFDVAGDIVQEKIDGTDPNGSASNYVYDAVGRLVEAHVPGHDLAYGFDPTGGCGPSEDAGRNANRTSLTDNGETTTYCYDHADRLVDTTAEGIDEVAYDEHGNTTSLGDQELVYDHADRHIETTTDDTTITYRRDAAGAIVQRSATGEPTLRYSGGPSGVALTLDTEGEILEKTVSLPGGVSVSIAPGEETWSYPNLIGSVAASADGDGVKQGPTRTYDPHGNPLDGVPDTREGDLDDAWVGAAYEHAEGATPLVEMGARVYSPLLGRFLQVDPVRGGSANDYDYANADPINNVDRTGNVPLAIAEGNGRDAWGIVHAAHYGYLKALKAAAARGRATWKSRWNRSLERSRRASAERRSWIKAFTHAKAISWQTAYDYANDLIWIGIRAEVRRRHEVERHEKKKQAEIEDSATAVERYIRFGSQDTASDGLYSSNWAVVADGCANGLDFINPDGFGWDQTTEWLLVGVSFSGGPPTALATQATGCGGGIIELDHRHR